MAKWIKLHPGKLFPIEMSDEDMANLVEVCDCKNCNLPDAVLACFHAGIVLIVEHCKRHGKCGD